MGVVRKSMPGSRAQYIAEYRLLGMRKFVEKYACQHERIIVAIGYIGQYSDAPEELTKMDIAVYNTGIAVEDLDENPVGENYSELLLIPEAFILVSDWLARGTIYNEAYIWSD